MTQFYSVGVGAGDRAYITLGAIDALNKSDIIAVPVKKHGEKSTALEIIKKEFDTGAKEILEIEFPMSRDSAVREKSHRTAAEKITAKLREGKTVAMITLGDVSVYSTCTYVHKHIKKAGFRVSVVAGVPSFCAAADKAMISLCEGNEAFAVIPSADTEKIESYIDGFDTVVIMKAGSKTDEIYALLEKRGLQNNAIVCGNIGMESEVIAPLSESNGSGYFTTIIVKKNLEL